MAGSESSQSATAALACRLAQGPALLLDGATGTELERRGLDTGLPLWSARALIEAPREVAAIHASYVAVGAELLTANTFRTQRRTLSAAGLGDRCRALSALAIGLAREAAEAAGRPVWVAGSSPTLEDCYHPERVPDAATCLREHEDHATALADGGADCILIETMNSIREATAASQAAAATGLPFFVSFVCWEKGQLLSREPLREACETIGAYSPLAILVNCLPPSAVAACIPELQRTGKPFGVYANLGGPLAGSPGLRTEDCTPAEFASHAERWLDAGARLLGGCCGTTPAHIAAVAEMLARRS